MGSISVENDDVNRKSLNDEDTSMTLSPISMIPPTLDAESVDEVGVDLERNRRRRRLRMDAR